MNYPQFCFRWLKKEWCDSPPSCETVVSFIKRLYKCLCTELQQAYTTFRTLITFECFFQEAVGPNPSNVAILSATSSGNETGAVTLTITYNAPLEHATHWQFYYSAKAMGSTIRTGIEYIS